VSAACHVAATLRARDSGFPRRSSCGLWHGTNDSALSYRTTTACCDRVVAHSGGRANADHLLRYDLAPGVNPCAGGPGADGTDLLAALDHWVTQRRAPGTLQAA
jgi:hypothetical protein